MKTRNLLTVIGLGLALGAPAVVSAQTLGQQPIKQQPIKQQQKKQPTMSIKAQMDRRARLLLSAQSSGAYDDDALGINFTDSSLLSVTRAGNLGNETGTMDSDVNGQIGTTDQNDMVNGSTNTGIFTSHFGPVASNRPKITKAVTTKAQTTKVNYSPQTKDNNQTNP